MKASVFAVRLSNKAEKQFKELEGKMQARAVELFKTLESNPVPKEQYDLLKVGGELDTYRIRLSSHRTVYRVFWQEKVVRIAKIEKKNRNNLQIKKSVMPQAQAQAPSQGRTLLPLCLAGTGAS